MFSAHRVGCRDVAKAERAGRVVTRIVVPSIDDAPHAISNALYAGTVEVSADDIRWLPCTKSGNLVFDQTRYDAIAR